MMETSRIAGGAHALVLDLAHVTPGDGDIVGAKAANLARAARLGLPVPPGVALTVEAYERFVDQAGLRPAIAAELARKPFEDMRWEELWDAALRIRNLFARASLPDGLRNILRRELEHCMTGWPRGPLVLRSSSPSEDAAGASFAGLHETFTGLPGLSDALDRLPLLFASLWNDRALMYRREMALDPATSAMAGLLQPFLTGEVSGVLFSESPLRPERMLIEIVSGTNETLVDGRTDPERVELDKPSGVAVGGVIGARGLLLEQDLATLFDWAVRLEADFGRPVDMEWTRGPRGLVLLQVRPIVNAIRQDDQKLWQAVDKRPWYASLSVSLEALEALRVEVEERIIPGMLAEAKALAAVDGSLLDDHSLADELRRRREARDHWKDAYWSACIPLAHGPRLLGRLYNDAVRPSDPYEFVRLLERVDGSTELLAVRRNRDLLELAAQLRGGPQALEDVARGGPGPGEFASAVRDFLARYGETACGLDWCEDGAGAVARLALELARSTRPLVPAKPDTPSADLETAFLRACPEPAVCARTLAVARAAWRLRDEDNLALGQVEAQLALAVREASARLGLAPDETHEVDGLANALENGRAMLPKPSRPSKPAERAEQGERHAHAGFELRGQPAGPGVASGPARLIRDRADVFAVRAGEIAVVDALDPAMTVIAPLVAGVVERRGGMLAHGAIIAREYGLACVTGVPGVMEHVRDGDRLTVDGYEGVVRVQPA